MGVNMETLTQKHLNDNNLGEKSFIFSKVDEFINKGEFAQALFILDSISEDNPNYSRALFCKSMIFGMMEEDEKSFKNFQNALSSDFKGEFMDLENKFSPLDMGDSQDLFNYGLTSYYFGDYQDAIEYFDLSLKLLPNQSEAIYYKALSLGAIGEFKKAINVIDKAIGINDNDYRFWNDKGAFLSDLDEVEKAHECFDKSIRINANSYNWANKAFLYHKFKDLKKALKCYDNAIKLNPDDIYPVIGKAKVYMELNDFKNAERYFEIACGIDDHDMEYLIEYGKYLLFKEQYGEAIRYFDKCLKYNDDLAFVWMFKAMALNQLGQTKNMQDCIDRAYEIDPFILSKFDEFF